MKLRILESRLIEVGKLSLLMNSSFGYGFIVDMKRTSKFALGIIDTLLFFS